MNQDLPAQTASTVSESALRVLATQRVAVFIVTYNAARHIEKVIRRIPAWVTKQLAEIYLIDDSSTDETVAVAQQITLPANWAPLRVYRTPYNQGYGGNQRLGYLYAIERSFDIVVLLHGDGQYAPEALPHILAAYDAPADKCPAAVFGSRFLTAGGARAGGMPTYKYYGNRVLTQLQNRLLGTTMSEMHSGYRSYSTAALRQVPFTRNAQDFSFDADIIVQFHAAGLPITEIPIPTFYGDEVCHVNGMQYAGQCILTALRYRLMQYEICYDAKFDIRQPPAGRDARPMPAIAALQNHLTQLALPAQTTALNHAANVATTAPAVPQTGTTLDVAYALDTLEHDADPEAAVAQLFERLRCGGTLYASTPNIAFWPIRLMLLLGRFNYSRRGILDLTHRRLFTVRAFCRLLRDAGFQIETVQGFGPPIAEITKSKSLLVTVLARISTHLANWWPTLFAYQVLVTATRTVAAADLMQHTFVAPPLATGAPAPVAINPVPPRPARGTAGWLTVDKAIFAMLLVLGVVSRWIAIPASLWEWDDILFARSLQHFSVVTHSPHPPGFPVFVALAKLAQSVTANEYAALTTVAFLFGIWLMPALYLLFCELFNNRAVALAGALLGGFTPVVWTFSAAGRSDSPAFVTGVIATTLLLKGRRSSFLLFLGCLLLGLGMGIRVTVGAAALPFLALVLLDYLRARQWRTCVTALALTALGGLAWYIPLIWHEGWEPYFHVVKLHRDFIWQSDSIFANTENGILSYRITRYFIDIWGAAWMAYAMYALATLGLLVLAWQRQWKTLCWLLAGFLPFFIFVFITVTPLGAPLYGMPFLPFYLGLAAYGLIRPCQIWLHKTSFAHLGMGIAVALTLSFAVWTYPVVRMLHRETSPPLQAIQHLEQTALKGAGMSNALLVFDGLFRPHLEFYLPQATLAQREQDFPADLNLLQPPTNLAQQFTLTETPLDGVKGERHFAWSSSKAARKLATLGLGRYFNLYVTPKTISDQLSYGRGWFAPEIVDGQRWRWMGPQSELLIFAMPQTMKLHLAGETAFPATPTSPVTITVRVNDVVIGQFTVTKSSFDQTLVLPPAEPNRLWSRLNLAVDRTIIPRIVNPAFADDRTLGLQVLQLDLTAAASTSTNGTAALDTASCFGAGWYAPEQDLSQSYRWMSGTSTTNLPALLTDGQIDLSLLLPTQTQAHLPIIQVSINGQTMPPLTTETGEFKRTISVPFSLHQGKSVELRLSIPPVQSPVDPRSFGLRATYLGWRPKAPEN